MPEMVKLRTPLLGKPVEVELLEEEGFISIYGDVISSCPMYGKGSVTFLSEIAMERAYTGRDTIFLVTGERREGKSTVGSRIALTINEKFPVSNVGFHLKEFNSIIAHNPECDPANGVYPTAILDEAGKELYAGDFAKRFAKSMVKRFQVIGKKREIVFLILPHKMFLVRGMRETLPAYWINVESFRGERGFAVVRTGDPNCHRLDKFWVPQFVFRFEELSGPWWDEYQKKKDAFIEETCADESDIADQKEEREPTWDEVAKKLNCSVSTAQRAAEKNLARKVA